MGVSDMSFDPTFENKSHFSHREILMARLLLILILLFGLPTISWSADFETGMIAYENQDYDRDLSEFQILAEEGHVNAQFILGMMYTRGEGVPKNAEAETKWLRRAAEQGHSEAQYHLSVRYFGGTTILPKNDAQAVMWARRSAEQGDDKGQSMLALMYTLGRGVPQDIISSYMWWYLSASKSSDPKAMRTVNSLAALLTDSQLVEARRRDRECEKRRYQGC